MDFSLLVECAALLKLFLKRLKSNGVKDEHAQYFLYVGTFIFNSVIF